MEPGMKMTQRKRGSVFTCHGGCLEDAPEVGGICFKLLWTISFYLLLGLSQGFLRRREDHFLPGMEAAPRRLHI
jgi:hypothetical protein